MAHRAKCLLCHRSSWLTMHIQCKNVFVDATQSFIAYSGVGSSWLTIHIQCKNVLVDAT